MKTKKQKRRLRLQKIQHAADVITEVMLQSPRGPASIGFQYLPYLVRLAKQAKT